MKLSYLATATAAVALLGGAASAQQPQPPQGPTAGSVTGDWNGAHAPSDEKQYQEKVVVPVGSMPAARSTAPMPADQPAPADTGAALTSTTAAADTGAAANASYTTMTVTNGPVPDTAENRARYGQPMSNAGKRTAARGN
ncbi:hypothetical protein [Phenylobacterium sp.]|uniref:hypothetical protein n=1 Tax=Phenylobacterium sp. TaxID=1871053 RepID=UPI0012227A36|nr:hypothetical protein [Phenylobacterium sp.]TAL36159.1 MAG: hypothetical protein EPN98_05365 [Phenylobacterium sp.]